MGRSVETSRRGKEGKDGGEKPKLSVDYSLARTVDDVGLPF